MKHHIVLAAVSAFAASANAILKACPASMELSSVSLVGGDHLSALLVEDSTKSCHVAGVLHEVSVLEGEAEDVMEELEAMYVENRHCRAIAMVHSVSPASGPPVVEPAADAESGSPGPVAKKAAKKASAKKTAKKVAKSAAKPSATAPFEARCIVIVGTFQP